MWGARLALPLLLLLARGASAKEVPAAVVTAIERGGDLRDGGDVLGALRPGMLANDDRCGGRAELGRRWVAADPPEAVTGLGPGPGGGTLGKLRTELGLGQMFDEVPVSGLTTDTVVRAVGGNFFTPEPEACWGVLGDPNKMETQVVRGEGGAQLASKNSLNFFKRNGAGSVAHDKLSGARGALLQQSLLYVLWAVDPLCYFFAYERGGTLHALETPEFGDIPTADALASTVGGVKGDRRAKLVLVLTRTAVRLLLHGVARLLTDALEDEQRVALAGGGYRWHCTDEARLSAARDRASAIGDENLLARFDERLTAECCDESEEEVAAAASDPEEEETPPELVPTWTKPECTTNMAGKSVEQQDKCIASYAYFMQRNFYGSSRDSSSTQRASSAPLHLFSLHAQARTRARASSPR